MSNTAGSVNGDEETSKEQQQLDKPWHSYISEDLPRTVVQSTDTAIRSARSLQHNSSNHLRTLQDSIPQVKSQYRTFEDAFFSKVKDELASARQHPFVAGGVAVTAALLLMRGPRRFLFRQTLGRFQSEEAQFVKAEQNVKALNLSVDLMKNESRKLLERASLAEEEMRKGHADLKDAGTHIRRLAKDVYKVEGQASDLMDGLREIPGREALRLRAEVSRVSAMFLYAGSLCGGQVASMESLLRQQRIAINKRIMKISELGIPV